MIDYVGQCESSSNTLPSKRKTGSPPVPHQFSTGSEKSPQMEDGGDNKEDGSKLGPRVPRAKQQARSKIKPDTQPTEVDLSEASKAGWAIERVRVEWPKFRDHHISKGSLMADWAAAWRNWIRNADQFSPRSRSSPAAPPKSKSYFAIAREMYGTDDEPVDAGYAQIINHHPDEPTDGGGAFGDGQRLRTGGFGVGDLLDQSPDT